MKHRTCGECGKTFSHATTTKVEQALRLHTQRVHTGVTTPPGTRGYPNGKSGHEPDGPLVDVEPEAKPRKKWTRKTTELTVSFCPCCGTNLQAVALGMAMSKKV